MCAKLYGKITSFYFLKIVCIKPLPIITQIKKLKIIEV